MLDKILSISGKPGLYKLISGTKKMIIVESLADKKRMPAYSNGNVISLNDIAIYTDEEEVPLRTVFETIKTKEDGKEIKLDAKTASPEELRNYLTSVLPNFDKERVHNSDIKKLILWYNILTNSGENDFSEPKKDDDDEKAEA
jgi:polyphosphate kinase